MTPLAIYGAPGTATVGTPFSWRPLVFGGAGAKTFARSGPALPAGLTFSASTGEISGTPTQSGSVSGIGITVSADGTSKSLT
nr:putative Ig domain-containing protein [Aureimonas sp. AU22]